MHVQTHTSPRLAKEKGGDGRTAGRRDGGEGREGEASSQGSAEEGGSLPPGGTEGRRGGEGRRDGGGGGREEALLRRERGERREGGRGRGPGEGGREEGSLFLPSWTRKRKRNLNRRGLAGHLTVSERP